MELKIPYTTVKFDMDLGIYECYELFFFFLFVILILQKLVALNIKSPWSLNTLVCSIN